MGQLDVDVASRSRSPLTVRVARACFGIAALTGMALAWVLFDWIGRYGEHCDFDSTCHSSWLPGAFMLKQYLWLASVFMAASGLAVAGRSPWPRRDLVVLIAAWTALFLGVGITPMRGGGSPMHMSELLSDPILYGSFPWYSVLSAVVAAASLAFGRQALRKPAP